MTHGFRFTRANVSYLRAQIVGGRAPGVRARTGAMDQPRHRPGDAAGTSEADSGNRQVNPNGGSATRLTCDGDVAAVPTDSLANKDQPKAVTAYLLGTQTQHEPANGVCIHANAAILDFDVQCVGMHLHGADGNDAATIGTGREVVGGASGVVHEHLQDLAEFAAIHAQEANRGGGHGQGYVGPCTEGGQGRMGIGPELLERLAQKRTRSVSTPAHGGHGLDHEVNIAGGGFDGGYATCDRDRIAGAGEAGEAKDDGELAVHVVTHRGDIFRER